MKHIVLLRDICFVNATKPLERGEKLIKAIIFDFDGLIVDTETAWFEAYKETMSLYKVDLPLERFVECVGSDNTALYEFFKQ